MVGFLKDQTTLDTVDICISLESTKNSKKNQLKKFWVSISCWDSRTGGSIQYIIYYIWFQGFYRYQIEALAILYRF